MKQLIFIMIAVCVVAGCETNTLMKQQSYKLPFKYNKNGLWGFISTDGDVILEPEFKNCPTPFYGKYSLLKHKGFYRCINLKGELSDERYKNITPFSEGYACAVNSDSHPYIIDENLNVVKNLPFAVEVGVFKNGLAKFKDKNNKWGFVNANGQIVIKAKYEKVSAFSDEAALVFTNDKSAYITTEGKYLFTPSGNFESLKPFSEGLAAYSNGNGWGYINKKGEKIIRAKNTREQAGRFISGNATYQNNGLWGLIDNKGNSVISAKYDAPLYFSDELSAYNQNDNYGFINQEGEKVIRANFITNVASPFINGTAIVKDDGYYITINKKGETTSSNEFALVDQSAYYNLIICNSPFNPETTIETDYFNVQGLIQDVFGNIAKNKLKGIDKSTTLHDLLTVSPEWEEKISGNLHSTALHKSTKLSPEVTFTQAIHFEDSLNKWDADKFEYTPNIENKVKAVKIAVRLSGKAQKKIETIYNAVNNKIEQAGYLPDSDNSSNISLSYKFEDEEKVVQLDKSYDTIDLLVNFR